MNYKNKIWGTEEEKLGLNLDTLWSGVARDTNNYHAKEYLKPVRQEIFAENYAKAAEMIEQHLLGEFGENYLPMGNLKICPVEDDNGQKVKNEEHLHNVPVQFCFGHGLSYTTFDYSDVKAYTLAAKGRSEKSDPLDEVTVITEVTVTNTGDRTGKEIVQVYVGMKDSKIDRAVKELRGFDKVELAPQESKVVQIPLTRRAFTYYDVKEKAFVVEPGEYQIYIAKSLQDVQDTVTVTMK